MAEKGGCFCGAVGVEVEGEPVAMGYCHCSSCRSWTGAPVYAFTMWPAQAVTVTRGEDRIATFLKTPETVSHRQHCTVCGGAVMIRHPSMGLIDIPSVALPSISFTPQFHVNYAEHVLTLQDGLPKFAGFPPDFGGSGQTMPE